MHFCTLFCHTFFAVERCYIRPFFRQFCPTFWKFSNFRLNFKCRKTQFTVLGQNRPFWTFSGHKIIFFLKNFFLAAPDTHMPKFQPEWHQNLISAPTLGNACLRIIAIRRRQTCDLKVQNFAWRIA